MSETNQKRLARLYSQGAACIATIRTVGIRLPEAIEAFTTLEKFPEIRNALFGVEGKEAHFSMAETLQIQSLLGSSELINATVGPDGQLQYTAKPLSGYPLQLNSSFHTEKDKERFQKDKEAIRSGRSIRYRVAKTACLDMLYTKGPLAEYCLDDSKLTHLKRWKYMQWIKIREGALVSSAGEEGGGPGINIAATIQRLEYIDGLVCDFDYAHSTGKLVTAAVVSSPMLTGMRVKHD